MNKKKQWSASSVVLLILGLGMILGALALLVPALLDYRKSNDTYDALNESFVTVDENVSADITLVEENDNWWYEEVDIDLKGIQQVNSDVIGWIRFDNIEILSYPVLYSGDDETYLRTDIYGNQTTAGCIFMEGANCPDFNDSHTIIYGHNMRNLSMFGSLKKYKEKGFYQNNQFFTIYTNDYAYRYQIFAFRDVPETSSVYTIGYGKDDTFQAFINEMIRSSYEDTGVTVTMDDKIITLSTCSTTGNRFVVHAVRVAEHAVSGQK